jgi:hypothetical protein
MYPLKRLQKLGSKKCNKSIKHKNRRYPLDFLKTPHSHSKEFENDCASMSEKHFLIFYV